MSRDFEQSIKTWQGTTFDTETCVGGTSQGGLENKYVFENHGQVVSQRNANVSKANGFCKAKVLNCRYKQLGDVCQTISATFGLGGNNQPFVVETPKTLKIRSGCAVKPKDIGSTKYCFCEAKIMSGGKGALIQDNKSATLGCNNDQTLFVPVMCVDQGGGKSACNITEEQSPTLTCTHGGEPVVCVQGSSIGRTGNNGPNGDGINEDISFTLNTVDKHAVVYAIDRESFNCGQNYERTPGISKNGINPTLTANGPSAVGIPTYSMTTGSFMQVNNEKAPTLVARDYKDPPIVNEFKETKYIVRRLTPKECARLQGFPDYWCDNLETENPTEEDIKFWYNVFEEHRLAMGKSTKPKSRNQIVKWLKNPHSDSAEYKLWGNGVALPCVVFVLGAIANNYIQNKP
ncbi:MAG: DNA cytosine methyltransferase [Lachnospirales bacterium]